MNNKDFLGNELAVNDWVIFTEKSYRNFFIGKLVKLTEKTVLIRHKYSSPGYYTETRQEYSQVIKVPFEKVGRYMFDEANLQEI